MVVRLEQDRAKADVGGIQLQMERLREIGVCQEVRGLERSLELHEAKFPSIGSYEVCVFFRRSACSGVDRSANHGMKRRENVRRLRKC